MFIALWPYVRHKMIHDHSTSENMMIKPVLNNNKFLYNRHPFNDILSFLNTHQWNSFAILEENDISKLHPYTLFHICFRNASVYNNQ